MHRPNYQFRKEDFLPIYENPLKRIRRYADRCAIESTDITTDKIESYQKDFLLRSFILSSYSTSLVSLAISSIAFTTIKGIELLLNS